MCHVPIHQSHKAYIISLIVLPDSHETHNTVIKNTILQQPPALGSELPKRSVFRNLLYISLDINSHVAPVGVARVATIVTATNLLLEPVVALGLAQEAVVPGQLLNVKVDLSAVAEVVAGRGARAEGRVGALAHGRVAGRGRELKGEAAAVAPGLAARVAAALLYGAGIVCAWCRGEGVGGGRDGQDEEVGELHGGGWD